MKAGTLAQEQYDRLTAPNKPWPARQSRNRYENVKTYLKRYLVLDMEIKRRMDEVEHLHMTLNRLVAVFSHMPKNRGRGNQYDQAIVKMIDLENSIKQDIELLVEVRQEIYDFIYLLEDESLRSILIYHYISGLTWDEVADKMAYSYQWVHKLHAKALRLLSAKKR